MQRVLSAFFCPKSVAIIGASDTPGKVGTILLKNIIDSKFSGQIYPVNPSYPLVQNLKCYPNVTAIPEIPDLAIIAIPAAKNQEVLEQIGAKGIKNVIAIAAGFKEAGPEGIKLETDLMNVIKKYSINLLGPNCLGFINNLCPINATFGEGVRQTGNLRFISQSGAIAASLFDWCNSTGLGFGEFITLGNKADLNENDIMEYFQNQVANTEPQQTFTGLSNVHPIGMYLESISDGHKFIELARKISKVNPIFILKPGKTEAAACAMQSHTGAIACPDAILETVFAQTGIIRAATLDDFFDLSRAFSWEELPLGPKVAIISNAGGPAVISADAVIGAGLELAEFNPRTKEQLAQILPRCANIQNPVDVLGDALAERFAQAIDIVLSTNQTDSLIVILTPQIMTQIAETAEIIGSLSKKYHKPIFCSFIGGKMVALGEQKLNEQKIPSFRFPERAINAISAMWNYKKWQSTQQDIVANQEPLTPEDLTETKKLINQASAKNRQALDNLEANGIVASVNISTPKTTMVKTLEEAQYFTENQGWPVVLKLSSPELLHKQDVGGVITGIQNNNQLETAWDKMKQNTGKLDPAIQNNVHIQIQKQIIGGVEVIIGIKRDPTFGPVLLFGAGGTLAELIADRNLHLLPLNIAEAKEFVGKSKISLILNGYRGEEPYNLDKLYETIIRLAKLAENFPEISDIEINPAIITRSDVWAVDTKIILNKKTESPINTSNFHDATAINCIVAANKFHYFDFETKDTLVFKPGQYISVKVAPDRINAYSIARRSGQNLFSLLVDTTPGGPGSQFFEKLKTGDKITYLGPFGTFTLNLNDGAKRLLFLATGSGIAPLRCQIDTLLKENACQLPITLYFGLSYPYDLFWEDYFQKLSIDYPNFKFKVVIWKPDNSWQGPAGFITQLLAQDITDAKDVSAYLCGNKQMIADATKILTEHGCPTERIYTEKQ